MFTILNTTEVTERLSRVSVGGMLAIMLGLVAIFILLHKAWSALKPSIDKKRQYRETLKKHDERLASIESTLGNVEQELGAVKDQLDTVAEDSREYRRASLSDKIFRKFQQYKKTGKITNDQLINFNEMVARYTKCLCSKAEFKNDIVFTKYVPEVRALEITDN